MLAAGSRVVHEPEYPELSRTVSEPPALGADEELLDGLALFEGEDVLLLLLLLLHAAAARVSAAAPARQAVRIDLSRKLTAFTYS